MPEHQEIIVYQSKTGFTEHYAQLLSARLGCEAIPLRDATAERVAGREPFIFASRVHAGRIDGLKKGRELFAQSGARTLILLVTGGTPEDAKDVIDKMWADNLTAEEREAIPHFYLPGGLRYERMSLPDRLIMKVAARMMKNEKNKTDTEAGFAQAIQSSYDNSSDSYIIPLAEYVEGLRGAAPPSDA